MAIYYTTNPSEFKLTDSVIIAEQEQPASGRLSGGSVKTGIVGNFPWGPDDELLEFDDGAELIETLVAGYSAPEDYEGYRAIANKQFGGPLRVVRVSADDAVKASRTLADSGTTDAVDITAKYLGAAGNEITTLWTNVDASTFDLEVTFGDTVETFEGISFDADGMAEVTEESDFVDLALNGAGGNNPDTDGAAVALTSGDDGTLSDTNYTGSDTDFEGLRVLRTMEDNGFAFVAEHTSSAIITELLLFAEAKRAHVAAQADASNDTDTNNTAAGSLSNERLKLFNHRVTQTINGTEFTVDLTAFYASIWSSIDPSESVAQAKYRDPYLTVITGLPDGVQLDRDEWIAADAVGAMMLEKLTGGGFKFHMDITSNTTDGKTSGLRRRMHDVVNIETGEALQRFANAKPTETNRRAAKTAMDKKLQTLQDNEQIAEFYTNEVTVTGDSVTYETKVRLYGELRFIINKTTVGENVVIEEVA